ncbi:hypothetical protein LEP1GSC017_2140 [Leptospira meyeri serovar Hardjo str. Went 5]|nr:hypothetical protein LEP1GSC017_2140 [Leptospira meyeri serovar Hardjo str. Went 5]
MTEIQIQCKKLRYYEKSGTAKDSEIYQFLTNTLDSEF